MYRKQKNRLKQASSFFLVRFSKYKEFHKIVYITNSEYETLRILNANFLYCF